MGSTTGIMDYVKHSDAGEFIIGTESAIVEHLQYDYPEKKFYGLSRDLMCPDMKLTTLADVLACVKGHRRRGHRASAGGHDRGETLH